MERIIIIETERNNFAIGGFPIVAVAVDAVVRPIRVSRPWPALRTRAEKAAETTSSAMCSANHCAEPKVFSSTTYHGFRWNAKDDAAGTQMRLGWLSTLCRSWSVGGHPPALCTSHLTAGFSSYTTEDLGL
jgi:hypothetical protein